MSREQFNKRELLRILDLCFRKFAYTYRTKARVFAETVIEEYSKHSEILIQCLNCGLKTPLDNFGRLKQEEFNNYILVCPKCNSHDLDNVTLKNKLT